MECRKAESADEGFEILVCFTDSMTVYERLRFGLQASAWFPSPWGVLVWRALHVLLIVAAPPLVAPAVMAILAFLALRDILNLTIWLLIGSGLIALCFTLMFLVLICVVIQHLCWCAWAEHLRKSLSESTLDIWKKFTRPGIEHFLLLQEGCLSWVIVKDFMAEWPFSWCRVRWTRWWEEVVHLHDATAI